MKIDNREYTLAEVKNYVDEILTSYNHYGVRILTNNIYDPATIKIDMFYKFPYETIVISSIQDKDKLELINYIKTLEPESTILDGRFW